MWDGPCDLSERAEKGCMILDAVQASDDADHRPVGWHVQPGAPGSSLRGRQCLEGIIAQAVRHADDLGGRDSLLSGQQRGHTRAVRQHTVGGAVRPPVHNPLDRTLAPLPPAAARDHSGDSAETSPRHAEDIAVDVVGVEHLDALAR